MLAVTETLALSLLASIGSCPSKELVRVKSAEEVLGEELVAMLEKPKLLKDLGSKQGCLFPSGLSSLLPTKGTGTGIEAIFSREK